MMATCQIRTLSSLELLLVKLQQAPENQHDYVPPALPSRPVMNSRRPRARKNLPLNLRNSGCDQENEKINDLYANRGIEKRAFLDSDNLTIQVSKEEDENQSAILKGVEIIQRCYHGHQARHYYNELKKGAIVLQSFVRGENARKDYQCLVTRLRAIVIIQKHMKKQHSRRLEQLAAIICLQSGIRGWLTRRQFDKMKSSHRNSRQTISHDMEDEHIKVLACTNEVQRLVLLDLQRRVEITEAALGRRRDENASLKEYILQFDEKSKQYEAKMQCMEKSWQDELTSIQTSLAAENGLSRTEPPSENGSQKITWVKNGDLHKLKQRFKAWKKDYKKKMQVVKATLKQLRHCDRGRSTKLWCRR